MSLTILWLVVNYGKQIVNHRKFGVDIGSYKHSHRPLHLAVIKKLHTPIPFEDEMITTGCATLITAQASQLVMSTKNEDVKQTKNYPKLGVAPTKMKGLMYSRYMAKT